MKFTYSVLLFVRENKFACMVWQLLIKLQEASTHRSAKTHADNVSATRDLDL